MLACSLMAGCSRQGVVTERDRGLCIRASDFVNAGFDIRNLHLSEEYQFQDTLTKGWTLNYTCVALDITNKEMGHIDFTVARSKGFAGIISHENDARQIEKMKGWVKQDAVVASLFPLAFAYSFFEEGEPRATCAQWILDGKKFTLVTTGFTLESR